MSVHFKTEQDIGKEGAVRQHHSFGESGGTGGVVDHRQFLGGVLIIVDTVGMEAPGIFLSEKLVEMLTGMGYLVIGSIEQGEIIHQYNGVQTRHLRLGKALPYHVSDKQYAGFGMIDQMIDVAALELVQQRHRYRSVCQGGEE